jgi:xanthine dehydrogenase/oxidase
VDAKVIVDVGNITELQAVTSSNGVVTAGSGVTLAKLVKFFSSSDYAPFQAASRHLSVIANSQVRSAGTWAGNLSMAQKYPHFPSDIFLTLSALSATLTFATYDGQVVANVPVQTFCKDAFFKEHCALIVSFSVEQKPGDGWVARRFKLTQRARNAHAHVSMFVVANVSSEGCIQDATVAVGGVTSAIEVCPKTSRAMLGAVATLDDNVIETFTQELESLGLNQEDDLTRKDYRLLAARNCLKKFYLYLNSKEGGDESLSRDVGGKGVQEYSISLDALPVTAPVPKIGARLQASGEAKYCHDSASTVDPRFSLHGAFVFSDEVGKRIEGISYKSAYPLGLVDYVDARDLKNGKRIVGDEVLFLSIGDIVPSVGYPVALVLFKKEEDANKVAAAVEITYSDVAETEVSHPVFSLADAIKYRRIFTPKDVNAKISKGDADSALAKAPMRLKGCTETGGQKHFYFETQSAVCKLGEGGEVEVRSSTQNVSGTQEIIGKLLGIGSSKVVVKQLRAGGGYGGKLTRSFQCSGAAALAAAKTGRTCAVVQDRGIDLQMIGGREPMIIEYDIGFDADGKILAVKFLIHAESGVTIDGSAGSLGMATLWMDHVYNVDNFSCEGILYKTNVSTNTSCRSPGNMQSNFVYEDLIYRIANRVGKRVKDVQELNFYRTGDVLPCERDGTSLGDLKQVNLQRCWRELHEKAKIEEKQKDIEAFNRTHDTKKRGLSCAPVKYGISGAGYKQQVRVCIYADGTVRVGTSGAEIGQGLATKVVQCVALRLGVDMEKIDVHESDTSNNTVNNGATGGSATSEVCCQAALNACDTLLARLKEHGDYEVGGDVSFADAVAATDGAGVSLSADGWNNPTCSSEFQYFVWVATAAVVELDVLTGEASVISADIQYDCGEQLNAYIDVGQIEGGFIMGLGYFLTEKVVFDQTGALKSVGTWEYKPPGMLDIPREFNVRLLSNVGNNAEGNVLRSKAVGEPPMVSSMSVWFAVREAVLAAGGSMDLMCPATIDERLLAINKANMNL